MIIKGKGSLSKTGPNTWVGRFSLGPDPSHPRKYLYSPRKTFHCEHEWEARIEMEKYRQELEENGIPQKSLTSIEQYAKHWFSLRNGNHNSPRTAERERLDIRHIIELFPDVELKQLTPLVIKTAYDEARISDRFDKEIYQINKRLRQILNSAIEDGLIKKNPALKVTIPKPEPKEKDYLDPIRIAKFNSLLLNTPLSGEVIASHILLHNGFRPGEVYAFSWSSFSFSTSRFFVGSQFSNDMKLRSPKSKASKDWAVVDGDLWAILFEWKQIQREYLISIGVQQTEETPIASNSLGGRLDPTNFGRWFRNFCADNGFGKFTIVTKTFKRDGKTIERGKGYEGLCPNMFRDIFSTQLVTNIKVDPRTLQSRMRYSDPSISLRNYTHPVLEEEYASAEAYSKLISRNGR